MAIKCCLIIVITIYEVAAYRPYAVNPYYTRESRPRPKKEMMSYVIDPRMLQSSYPGPYSYPSPPEPKPANYPVYQKPAEPKPVNYPVYQHMEPQPASYPVYQHMEPQPASYPVYQHMEPQPASYPVYQHMEPQPASYPVYQPAEPKPTNYPIYQTREPTLEIHPIEAKTTLVPQTDKPTSSPGFDSNILNNLAIALQLLIINNLINNPLPDFSGLGSIKNTIEEISRPYEPEFEYPVQMPNAKFLGSSNFDDVSSIIGFGNYGSPPPSPRIGAILKSPYDSLTSTSHSSDYSSSASAASKSNFQSPYAAIFAADNIKELFSMSDFY